MSSAVSSTVPVIRAVRDIPMAKATRRKPMSEINVVPYIDVMLVLLVIFMVTAPLMTQGIKVDLPEAASGPLEVDDDEPMLVVSVKENGSYYINVGEEEEPVPLKEIGENASKIIAANPDIKVLVEGDKNLPYGVIIDLMNTLQVAGAGSVGLITEPPVN